MTYHLPNVMKFHQGNKDGGDGNDELTGGKGADSFNCGAGNDQITNFNRSEGDKKMNDCERF
jgi:Ca2+-binding RTX toxin-like protein